MCRLNLQMSIYASFSGRLSLYMGGTANRHENATRSNNTNFQPLSFISYLVGRLTTINSQRNSFRGSEDFAIAVEHLDVAKCGGAIIVTVFFFSFFFFAVSSLSQMDESRLFTAFPPYDASRALSLRVCMWVYSYY